MRSQLFLLLLLFANFSFGQSTEARPVFSSIPFWQADGPPPDLADKVFVYLDYAAQEYVVSYPKRTGDGRVEFRIEAQFAVSPEVRATIRRAGDGVYTYDYTVRNEPGARRPIREFALIASVEDSTIALRHQAWRSILGPLPRRPDGPADGPRLLLRAGVGRVVSWRGEAANAIAQSQSGAGFQITSRFLPGITTAFGSSGIPANVPNGLPAEVAAQLEPVLAPEHNWKKLVTIGPKFNPAEAPTNDPVWIAGDFLVAIANLRLQTAVESPFLDELVSVVEAVRAGGQRVPFRLKQSPKTPLEAEIGEAARFSLSVE